MAPKGRSGKQSANSAQPKTNSKKLLPEVISLVDDNVSKISVTAPPQQQFGLMPMEEEKVEVAAKDQDANGRESSFKHSNQLKSEMTAQRNNADLNVLKQLFRNCFGYELKVELNKPIIVENEEEDDLSATCAFPYIEFFQSTGGGQQIQLKAFKHEPFCKSPLIDNHYCDLNTEPLGQQSFAINHNIDENFADFGKEENSFNTALMRKIEKACYFFTVLGRACTNLKCGHFPRAGFSYSQPIQIVNNMHVLGDDRGMVKYESIKKILINAIRGQGTLVTKLSEIGEERDRIELLFTMPVKAILAREKDAPIKIYEYSEDLKRFQEAKETDFVNGIYLTPLAANMTQAAKSYCRDVGIKESFQSLILSAINGMLKCVSLRDHLNRGFVSASGFLMHWLYHNYERVTKAQFERICQRFISTAGDDMDKYCNFPIAIVGTTTDTDGYQQASKKRISNVTAWVQIQLLMCYDLVEEQCMLDKKNGKLQDLYIQQGFIEAQDLFRDRIAKEIQKQYKEDYERDYNTTDRNLFEEYSYLRQRAVYTMLETWHNSETPIKYIHVLCLVRLDQNNELEICFLKVVPEAKYPKYPEFVDEFAEEVKDEEGFTQELDDDLCTKKVTGKPGAFMDRQYYTWQASLEREFRVDERKEKLRNQHRSEVGPFWQDIYNYINGYTAGLRTAYERLAQVLVQNFGHDTNGLQLALKEMKEYQPLGVKFYGPVYVEHKKKDTLWQLAYELRLAGSETVRHFIFNKQTLDKMFTEIAELKQFFAGNMKRLENYQLPPAGIAVELSHQNHVQQIIAAIRDFYKKQGAAEHLVRIEGSILVNESASQLSKLGSNMTPAVKHTAAIMQARSESVAESLKAVNIGLLKESYIVKQMMINISSLAMWSGDEAFVRQLNELADPDKLHDSEAKLPYYTGFHFKSVNNVISAEYGTLWPIYPIPHFIQPKDFFDIVQDFKGIPAEIDNITVHKHGSKQAINLMKDVFKHMWGWLLSKGCILTEQEFKHQAMQAHVVQNFLLFPLGFTWSNFELTLGELMKEGLSFIQGFIKTKTSGAYGAQEVQNRQKLFREAVIRLQTNKHCAIKQSSVISDYTISNYGKLDQSWQVHSPMKAASILGDQHDTPSHQRLEFNQQLYSVANFTQSLSAQDSGQKNSLLKGRSYKMINPYDDLNKPSRNQQQKLQNIHDDFRALDIDSQKQKDDLSVTQAFAYQTRKRTAKELEKQMESAKVTPAKSVRSANQTPTQKDDKTKKK